MGTAVPRGITSVLPVVSLASVHPVMFTGPPALCDTLISTYSCGGCPLEMYSFNETMFRYAEVGPKDESYRGAAAGRSAPFEEPSKRVSGLPMVNGARGNCR